VTIAEIAPVSPIVSALATLLLIAWMLRARERWPLDVPNERSLHVRPVPRSGGIAMMAGVLSGFAILQTPLVVVLPAAMLVALSHFDDLRGLPSRSGSAPSSPPPQDLPSGLSRPWRSRSWS